MKVCEFDVVVVAVGVAAFVLPAKMCAEARIPKQITLSFMCMYVCKSVYPCKQYLR